MDQVLGTIIVRSKAAALNTSEYLDVAPPPHPLALFCYFQIGQYG